MSYSTAGSEKFTMIDDLPNLDDLESYESPKQPGNGLAPDQSGKYQKFIRGKHEIPTQAGMVSRSHSAPPMSNNIQEQYMNMTQNPLYNQEQYAPPAQQQQQYNTLNNGPTCIDVADHIANCPICSQFYKNDKTVYIISIIILAIICLLLLKKVLDL